MKHVFISVGEASGDEHAASLITELKNQYPDKLTFSGLGGDKMKASGCHILYPLANFGVTGVTEVIKHLASFVSAFKTAARFIKNHQIDLLILIDFPGFNLRLAKYAKKHGVKVLYYISPQLWAWKAKRLQTIKRYVDTMAVIFPFEKKLFTDANVNAHFVGHPLSYLKDQVFDKTLLKHHKLENKRVIALLPGSRKQEIESLLNIMLQTAERLYKKHPDIRFVLPLAPTIKKESIEPYLKAYKHLPLEVVNHQHTHAIIKHSTLAIVASGTASLETMLLATPMVIIYKTSRLTYAIATQLIKVKYIGLPNLLADKMITPELVQDDLNSDNLFSAATQLLSDKKFYELCRKQLDFVGKTLAKNSADCRLSLLVANMLS